MTETTPSSLGNVITIDNERTKNHLDRVVRGSVEETEVSRVFRTGSVQSFRTFGSG